MRTLVIGGTGPAGPHVVEGLLDRGFDVTVFHSGQHEVTFTRSVEHLHGDPHFRESLEEVLGDRTYDVVVAMYGRLRFTADVVKGRTRRLIAVTGLAGYAPPEDPRWGPLGRPFALDEQGPWLSGPEADPFGHKIHLSEEQVLAAHRDGVYGATIIRVLMMYGPRQPGPEDWCIVRRLLDGRKRMIVADGGLKIEARLYAENAAAAILLAVDQPERSAGKRYNVQDGRLYTLRQRIELVARVMGREVQLVDMPYALARPCHPLWRHRPGHFVADDRRIREELGHRDAVPAEEAIPRAVRWLLEHPPRPGGEEEAQLGDPFDYAQEDALIRAWERAAADVAAIPCLLPPPAHRYRHPKARDEAWLRPDSGTYLTHLEAD